MLRRKPTRIELKLEDMEEYENIRKEQDKRSVPDHETTPEQCSAPKSKRELIHERIGYHHPSPAGPASVSSRMPIL